jgi:hypothetical protein
MCFWHSDGSKLPGCESIESYIGQLILAERHSLAALLEVGVWSNCWSGGASKFYGAAFRRAMRAGNHG